VRCRHTPKTLDCAAIAGELRDIEKLQCKPVGFLVGCSGATAA
jgi:hypothetical protein